MDLTLLELDQLEGYLKEDGLRTVLLDKDSRLEREIIPTDQEYHIRNRVQGALMTAATNSGTWRFMWQKGWAGKKSFMP